MIWKEIVSTPSKFLTDVLHLYDQLFPIEVREPHEVLLKGLKLTHSHDSNAFHFLIGLDEERVISFATAHYLADVNAGFIVYLGTDPSFRNTGTGTKTLLKMEELLNQDAIKAGFPVLRSILLEVEQIEKANSDHKKMECIIRNHFFEKNGYHLYEDIQYVQPPLHSDEDPVPLHLFVKIKQGLTISKEEILAMIYSMYRNKYGKINKINEKILHACLHQMEWSQDGSTR